VFHKEQVTNTSHNSTILQPNVFHKEQFNKLQLQVNLTNLQVNFTILQVLCFIKNKQQVARVLKDGIPL
jgi:hypothetical protein